MAFARARSTALQTRPQQFALVAGATYLLVGIAGMSLTSSDLMTLQNGDTTFLIFAVNVLHNLLHLAVGALWLVASQVRGWARNANLLLGSAYAIIAVLGFTGMLHILAIDSLLDPDNLLHLATAVAAIYFGSRTADNRLNWSHR